MSAAFLRDRLFWLPFVVTLLITGMFFAWEMTLLAQWVPSPVRPPADAFERIFALMLSILLSINVGLYRWRSTHGSCPIGARNGTGLAGIAGACALICPVCLLFPITILGSAVAVSAFVVFQPLLFIVAMILAIASLVLLWPRTEKMAR